MNTLGKRIKLARGKVSQEQFSSLLKISKGSLGFYERDENLPNTAVVLKICSETGVQLEWLMTGRGSMYANGITDPVYTAVPEVQPTETTTQNACQRCAKLEAKLEKVEAQRDELAVENRQLWKENGDLREEVAAFRATAQQATTPDQRRCA